MMCGLFYMNSLSITQRMTTGLGIQSLDVPGDIWYSIFIYNITAEPITLISCTDCDNITETQHTFTPDYPSLCRKYIFTIIPFNGAGQGQSSENITDSELNDIQNMHASHKRS